MQPDARTAPAPRGHDAETEAEQERLTETMADMYGGRGADPGTGDHTDAELTRSVRQGQEAGTSGQAGHLRVRVEEAGRPWRAPSSPRPSGSTPCRARSRSKGPRAWTAGCTSPARSSPARVTRAAPASAAREPHGRVSVARGAGCNATATFAPAPPTTSAPVAGPGPAVSSWVVGPISPDRPGDAHRHGGCACPLALVASTVGISGALVPRGAHDPSRVTITPRVGAGHPLTAGIWWGYSSDGEQAGPPVPTYINCYLPAAIPSAV